jgi:hypothetical protein
MFYHYRIAPLGYGAESYDEFVELYRFHSRKGVLQV